MSGVRPIIRYAKRLGQVSESGAKYFNRTLRCSSTLAQHKFVEGRNGEKFSPSPFGEIVSPSALVHEYALEHCERFANYIALECGVSGRKYTYAQTRDAANYVARSLANMGLKQHDMVALIAPNYPETIISFYGILEAGLVVTTVNPFYTQDEISRQLKVSGTKAVITVAEIAKTVLAAAKDSLPPGAPIVVIEDGTGPVPDGTIPFKDLLVKGKTLPSVSSRQMTPEDFTVMPFSSGTTGFPKGVMLTHSNLVKNIEMLDASIEQKFWQEPTESFQEVIPFILPFFHILGMNCMGIARLRDGVRLITLPKFMPEDFIKILDNTKVTSLFLVPPIVLFLTASPFIKKSHMEHIHHAISGAAPISKTDVDKFYDKFHLDVSKLKFCQGYGLTEASPVCFFESSGDNFASIGKNVASCDVRLVDISTNENISTPGRTGELWVRGPHIMKGYYNNEAATKETIVDGWLRTGDIAYFDEDFDFYVTDRLKELIKVKGFQVAPAELEALLRMHPGVEEAAVVGIPDDRSGEVPKAFILPKKGMKPTQEDIENFVKGKVSEHKQLRGGVTFVDNIPKNPSGKILRTHLKRQYLQ